MRAIPSTMLIHECVRKIPLSSDLWGRESFSEQPLKRVRFEFTREAGAHGEIISALLFYDEQNSRGRKGDFTAGEKIEYGGRKFTVSKAKPLYDGLRLHHWELELTGGDTA